jgi:hypothetical protein
MNIECSNVHLELFSNLLTYFISHNRIAFLATTLTFIWKIAMNSEMWWNGDILKLTRTSRKDLVHMGTSDSALVKIENYISKFQKNWNIYLEVANYLLHKYAKIHIQILYYGLHKKEKCLDLLCMLSNLQILW